MSLRRFGLKTPPSTRARVTAISRSRPLLATVIAVLLAVTVGGQRPAQAALVARTRTLANGFEIIVVESRLAPIVSMAIAVRGGIMVEGPKDGGLGHLLEHMLFGPNQVHATYDLLNARVHALGLGQPGETDEAVMRFGLTGPVAQLEGAMELLRDMGVSPHFDPAALAIEKRLIDLERAQVYSDEGAAWIREMDRVLWWKYPSRKPSHFAGEGFAALTIADLERVKRRYLVPDNAALIVVGNVDAARVLDLAERLFGGWRRGLAPRSHVAVDSFRHPPLRTSQLLLAAAPTPVAAGALVWQGPSTPGPESSLSDAAHLLSVAFNRDLTEPGGRPKTKPCRAVELTFAPSVNVGKLTVYWLADLDRVDACLQAIAEALPAFARGLTDDALQLARQGAEAEILRARERPEAMVGTLAAAWATRALPASLDVGARLRAVGREDIGRLVDQFIVGRPFLLSIQLPQSQIAGGLDRGHFEALMGKLPLGPAAR
jgi:predicted Zn-dependent peptidase